MVLSGICLKQIAGQQIKKGTEMKKFSKEILWSFIVGIMGGALILFQALGGNLANKTIIDFFVITMIIPAVVLIICGLIIGRKNTLAKILPYFLIVTGIVFGATLFSMIHIYESGAILDMLANTKTSENIVLEINDSITFGTVMQQALVCIVCAWLGTMLGKKIDGILSKVRN